MERMVNFRPRQQQVAADHNNLQLFARESLDDLVFDAIEDGKAFAGFQVTLSTPTQAVVAPGRLYDSGRVYITVDNVNMDFFSVLPVAAKKVISIVAWGTDADLDVQPRDFLINATTRETQPDAVSMEKRRVANIDRVAGVESADPVAPTVDTNLLVIATVTLGPAGIQSITMVADHHVPNLADVERRTGTLEDWEAITGPRISTIASDLAKLAAALEDKAANRDLTRVFADIARLKVLQHIPDTYSDYAADYFLTNDLTDNANLELLATIEEGIRFSPAAESQQEMSLFSNLDPNALVTNGFLLPKWTSVRRIASVAYAASVNISQYGYQTAALVKKFMSRRRVRYGKQFTVCTNSAWWRAGTYDPNTHVFTKAGETFILLAGDPAKNHTGIRLEQFWTDTYKTAYWDYVVTNRSANGAIVAQTFLNSADGWLTQIGLFFAAKAAAGDVNVLICETVNGAPDVTRCIADVVLPFASIIVSTTVSTKVPLPPTLLQAGQRYAIVLISAAAHSIGIATTNAFTQGTFFYSTDGVYQMGDLTKDMMFELYFATFAASRVSIQLNPISLSGGVSAVDILAESAVPENCQLTYEVQIGGIWYPLTDLAPNLLVGLPPLLPLRATFVGTTDIAAGVMLTGSVCHFSRPRTDFNHISSLRTLAGASANIKVIERLEKFNEPHHDVTVRLWRLGVEASEEIADAVQDVVIDATTIERTWTFNIASGVIASYKIRTFGTTTTPLDPFHVAERVDITF